MSFLIFGPIPSQNLLFKLEEKFTVHFSSLCTLTLRLQKNALILAKPCSGKKSLAFLSNHCKKIIIFNFIDEKMLFRLVSMHLVRTPWTHHRTGQEGHLTHFLREDDSCERTVVIHSVLFIYYSTLYILHPSNLHQGTVSCGLIILQYFANTWHDS